MRLAWVVLVLLGSSVLAQVKLVYSPARDDVADTGAVLIRSTRSAQEITLKARAWLDARPKAAMRDTVAPIAGGACLIGRPLVKLSDWVVASFANNLVVTQRTLAFDLVVWYEADSLHFTMSRVMYTYVKKKSQPITVPLTDAHREQFEKDEKRRSAGKEPKPDQELIDFDRALSYFINRLANALADP